MDVVDEYLDQSPIGIDRVSVSEFFTRNVLGQPIHLIPRALFIVSSVLIASHMTVAIVLAVLVASGVVPPRVVMPVITSAELYADLMWIVLIDYYSFVVNGELLYPLKVCAWCATSTSIIGFVASMGNLILEWGLYNLTIVYSTIGLFSSFAYVYLAYTYWYHRDSWLHMAIRAGKQA